LTKKACLLLRSLRAEHRHECRLARLGVLARTLAGGTCIAGVVDEVVRDLERKSDVARVAAVRGSRIGRQARHDARRFDGIFDQRAGLELLKASDCRQIELLTLGGKIHHLPARHAGWA
jgi:hypothetical protein